MCQRRVHHNVWKCLSFSLDSCLNEEEYIAAYKKIACSTVFVCFNYLTSFSNDDFSSFKNSAKEERLLRNDILSLKLRCHNLSSRFKNFRILY